MLNDAAPNSINFYNMNQDLVNLTSLQVLDKIVAAAAARGILIMFDMHSFLAGTFMEDGLWYDSAHPESLVLQTWDKLLARYNSSWNVFALDLKNEPFATTWGTGINATDWSLASARIGNHILGNGGSDLLIFVEGTASSPACTQNCFWGENLMGVPAHPVLLSNNQKLVYSPHCYGPSVAYQPYFQNASFPANMPAIWDAHYGFLKTSINKNAFVIGEWGGIYSGQDQVWMDAYVTWLQSIDSTDTFFWCLNPDSGDTGGLLENDWITPCTDKLTLLQKLVPNPTNVTQTANGKFRINF